MPIFGILHDMLWHFKAGDGMEFMPACSLSRRAAGSCLDDFSGMRASFSAQLLLYAPDRAHGGQLHCGISTDICV